MGALHGSERLSFSTLRPPGIVHQELRALISLELQLAIRLLSFRSLAEAAFFSMQPAARHAPSGRQVRRRAYGDFSGELWMDP